MSDGRHVSTNAAKSDTVGVSAVVPPRLLKPEDVATALAVPVSWVYTAARDGRIPCVKLGRYVRFLPETVDQAIAALLIGPASK